MKSLCLDIYHYKIAIESNHQDLVEKLGKDFSQYLCQDNSSELKLLINFLPVPKELKSLPYRKVFKNASHYDYSHFRVLNYDGSVFVIYDYSQDHATIYGEEFDRVHEVAYLLILSRMGKSFDLSARHRIHAAAFELNGKSFVLPLASGVGKSTLILEALKNEGTVIYSDDSPLIDEEGNLWPLHFRMGFTENSQEKLMNFPLDFRYSINRKEHGLKYLLDVEAIKSQLAQGVSNKKSQIIFGKRTSELEWPKVDRIGRLHAFYLLIVPMLIGYGLPILLEYFWESGARDFMVKIKIALSRMRSAWRFISKSDLYYINFTDIPSKNLKVLEGLK